jgi:ElaB/YqjD/DUF883 family membrane-anchored ribosome-binding protein
MADPLHSDPLHSTSENPSYDTYPGPASSTDTGVHYPTPPAQATSEAEWPGRKRWQNTRLTTTARQVGHAAGYAVGATRQLPQQFGRLRSRVLEMRRDAREGASERMAGIGNQLAEKAGDQIDDVKMKASAKLSQFQNRAAALRYQWSSQANMRVDQARREVRRIADERPVETILAAAGIAFGIGMALRVWRSKDGEY